jgi:hypothetical protein
VADEVQIDVAALAEAWFTAPQVYRRELEAIPDFLEDEETIIGAFPMTDRWHPTPAFCWRQRSVFCSSSRRVQINTE